VTLTVIDTLRLTADAVAVVRCGSVADRKERVGSVV
jgi:hypothetical protein